MEISNEKFIIAEFEKQRKQVFESNEPNDDFKIIQTIAENLNVGFLEVLNVIEAEKNNLPQANYINTLPTAKI